MKENQEMYRLHLQCSEPLLRQAFKQFIQTETEFKVVEEPSQADIEVFILLSLKELETFSPPQTPFFLVSLGPKITPEKAQVLGVKDWIGPGATLEDIKRVIQDIEQRGGGRKEAPSVPRIRSEASTFRFSG